MSNRKSDESGFSLLEVIVALSIMAVGFVTILKLFSGSIRSVGMSKEYLKGVSLANHKMNELELINFMTEEFFGQFEGEEDYRWELDIQPYETPLNKVEANIQLIEVKLKVFWNQFGKEGNVELVTLRTVGDIYPSLDSVLLGTNLTGIYGNVVSNGGAGAVNMSGSETEAESSPSEEESEAQLSGIATGFSDISGLRSGGPQAVLSGISSN